MSLNLIVRKTIEATPTRLFQAWTDPEQLVHWWGPAEVRCSHAEVEPKAGGKFRIDNRFADGSTLTIVGEFVKWSPPALLSYTWVVGALNEVPSTERDDAELVTVRFEPRGSATEVIVVHERIQSEDTKRTHSHGWHGCLDGLSEFIE
jgi:uncharacterized protein YndB with AHSA1/START domain